MKLQAVLLSICCVALPGSPARETAAHAVASAPSTASSPATGAGPGNDNLVYADFEKVEDNRPVSSRGGSVKLFAYQERTECHFKGAGGADVPELVRLSKDDPNRAAAFDYELMSPNQYAGVTLEVHGLPDQDGKLVAEDVSGFKFLTLQLYATGIQSVTVEFVSKGQGLVLQTGPQLTFKVTQGFNTYRVPLKSLGQPSWVDVRTDPKEVLKKLTSVNVTVSCSQCVPMRGTIIVDNLVFQN
jgi:hypothetical protein